MHCPRCSGIVEDQAKFCEHCGGELTPPADPLIGRTLLNEYVLVKKIGGGGFGAIYQAQQPAMNRLVAIKILHKHLSQNAQLVKRFHREGMAASKLDHPSAVKMYNSGETEDGYHWIAMEWLEGESLDKRLQQGPLSPPELLTIFGPICEVLAEAHQKGIFHRDLKPENIMLTPYPGGKTMPKLLDFGIAAVANDRMTINENSTVVSGTPQYMPPEQWLGLAFTDARTDIYALGVICYQCLSTRLPFQADTATSWRQQHCEVEPLDLESAAKDQKLSAGISLVIMKALSKDPEARYQNALDLKSAIEAEVKAAYPPSQKEIVTEPILRTARRVEPAPKSEPVVPPEGKTLLKKPPLSLVLGILVGLSALGVGAAGILGAFGKYKPPQKPKKAPASSQASLPVSTPASVKTEPQSQSQPATSLATSRKTPTPERQTLRRAESKETLAAISGAGQTLYAVGDFGRVLRSSDLGATWDVLESVTTSWLNGLWLSEEKAFYAVGAQGTVLRYQNDAWEKLQSGSSDDLYAISGVDPTAVLVVGAQGTILRSVERGPFRVIRSGTQEDLRDLWADQKGLVFVCGHNGKILRSKDSGKTWEALNTHTNAHLFGIYGRSSTELYAVGEGGVILRSQDGGDSWTQTQYEAPINLRDIFISEQGIYLCSDEGTLLRSEDGITFSLLAKTERGNALRGLWGSAGGIFAVGFNNEIVRFVEGKAELLWSGSTPHLSSIWGSEKGLFTVGAAGSLFRSSDNGKTWEQATLSTEAFLSGVWAGASAVYAVGEGGVYFFSQDGLAWEQRDTGTKNLLSNVYGTLTGDLHIVGGGGLILHSLDNGSTWIKRESNAASNLFNLWESEEGTLYVVGANGAILRSKDDALTWTRLVSNTTNDLIGIWGKSAKELYAVGEKGTILHSEDAGDSWRALQSGTQESLWCLWGDEERLVAVGDHGTVLASFDDGETWQNWPSETTQRLSFVWGNSLGDIYIVGDNGTMLHYAP